MEILPSHEATAEIEKAGIKDLFDVGDEEKHSPHSIYDESLTFKRKHSFDAYNKTKTIDQYTSKEDGTFFRITRKRETQFLSSQLLGGVIQSSPIYIDEEGEYFSKKVSYKENMIEAASGLFILNVLAHDWDHEIPYKEDVKVRNYENGSFYDFSHSDIASKGTQEGLSESQIRQKVDTWLQETRKRLIVYAGAHKLDVTQKQIETELKSSLSEKLRLLYDFVSSDKAIKEMYYKIGYFEQYQHELLDPEELQEVLVRNIDIALSQIESSE